MINNIIRIAIYFIVLVLVQVLILNNIHFFRIAIPFLYIYFILKLPVEMSKSVTLILSFAIGLVVDIFSNTPGMHAAACTLTGFCRSFIIHIFMGRDLPEGISPSYRTFGFGGFMKYTITLVMIHHISLFMIESLTIFDPLFLALRVIASGILTTLLIATVEAFNIERQKVGE